ncbi:ankyrin repeat domain-containing protein, partial [bacterium]|nr:ankyrin repeat domain-containing protein [bacterium]
GALIQAARDGDIEAVKQHLAAGANVNAKDTKGKVQEVPFQKGWTSLHHAAGAGHKEIVQLLIKKKADTNAKAPKSSGGHTPIDLTRGHPEITELLHKHGSKHSRMNRAVGVGYVKAVEACLDAGMDVNKKGPLGTPLDQAIKWERTEVANFLRERGGKTSAELRQKR